MTAQRGNVLFLILIAVALFAALSYAVTQSTRSGGTSVSTEKVRLLVNQLETMKSSLTQAYMRLRLSGCGREDIYFYKIHAGQHQTYVDGTFGGSMTGDGNLGVANSSCDLFSSNGGGFILPYATLEPPDLRGVYFGDPANTYFALQFYNDSNYISTPTPDLIAMLQLIGNNDATVKVCEEINRRQGLPTSTSNDWVTMSNDIGGPIGNMMSTNTLTHDFFCDGGGITIVMDPR